LLAVTNSDEVNMVACQVAHTLFKIPTKMARVRSSDYLNHAKILFSEKSIPIDSIISPEQIVTNQIKRLIEYPGALQVIDFADGKIRLVRLKAYYGGALVGQQLRQLNDHLPSVNTRVAAIFRGDEAIIPTGRTVIEPDDEVFFISTQEDIRKVMKELRKIDDVGKKVMLAGAGNIGLRLALSLEASGYKVKLIERDEKRAAMVSEILGNTMVLHGDAADRVLLRNENVQNMELFCSLTNADEANILSAMMARDEGARRTIAIVNRSAYVDLIESSMIDIDIAISPRVSTVSALLSRVRRGDVIAAHSLRRGRHKDAEVIEAVAHGDHKHSRLVGRKLSGIKFPEGTTICAILRQDQLVKLNKEVVIEEHDHIIIFVIDKRRIPEVEKLFQVSATFF
jgi:trk system potassium uptake protein TrkA